MNTITWTQKGCSGRIIRWVHPQNKMGVWLSDKTHQYDYMVKCNSNSFAATAGELAKDEKHQDSVEEQLYPKTFGVWTLSLTNFTALQLQVGLPSKRYEKLASTFLWTNNVCIILRHRALQGEHTDWRYGTPNRSVHYLQKSSDFFDVIL